MTQMPLERRIERAVSLRRKVAQAVLRLDRQERRMAQQQRKADTRRKIELGGLAIKAGLGDWDAMTLLGALSRLADAGRDRERRAAWRAHGLAVAGKAKPRRTDPVALVVRFPNPPPRAVRDRLKQSGFTYDPVAQCWRGFGHRDAVDAIAREGGGHAEPA